jgi:hypothetical protein
VCIRGDGSVGAGGVKAARAGLQRGERQCSRDDFAQGGSIYPLARDTVTRGRQLEELAFEVVVTESLTHAGKKAARLSGRGVRRVFAIDVEHGRCLEWSVAVDGWEILGADAAIEDPALVPSLPIRDLVSAAVPTIRSRGRCSRSGMLSSRKRSKHGMRKFRRKVEPKRYGTRSSPSSPRVGSQHRSKSRPTSSRRPMRSC